jgi:integrase/recombinase XerD
MLARGLAVDTIKARCRLVSRFVEFTNEYPWQWRPLDLDQFLADLRSLQTPITLSTLRSYSNAISMFVRTSATADTESTVYAQCTPPAAVASV